MLVDNVEGYMAKNGNDWSRVIACILSGQEWQVKSLGLAGGDVTRIFAHLRGAYFHFQDEKCPAIIMKVCTGLVCVDFASAVTNIRARCVSLSHSGVSPSWHFHARSATWIERFWYVFFVRSLVLCCFIFIDIIFLFPFTQLKFWADLEAFSRRRVTITY